MAGEISTVTDAVAAFGFLDWSRFGFGVGFEANNRVLILARLAAVTVAGRKGDETEVVVRIREIQVVENVVKGDRAVVVVVVAVVAVVRIVTIRVVQGWKDLVAAVVLLLRNEAPRPTMDMSTRLVARNPKNDESDDDTLLAVLGNSMLERSRGGGGGGGGVNSQNNYIRE